MRDQSRDDDVAKLIAELANFRERESATSEILNAISLSRADEKPVFDLILEKAAGLCGAPLAFLTMLEEDGEHFVTPAHFGNARSEFVERLRSFRGQITSTQLTARALRESKILRIDDIADDDLYSDGDKWRVELVDVEGIRSALLVPLKRDDRVLGVIMFYRREVAPFSDDHISLALGFAAQAVIAIENVRQFKQLQTRLEREAATREILEVISQSRDDDGPVFDVILDRAAHLCDAQGARLVLTNEDRTKFKVMRLWGDVTENIGVGSTFEMLPSRVPARAILNQCVVHETDLRETETYKSGDPAAVRVADEDGIRTLMAVPLIHKDVAIGCIGLSRKVVAPFNDEDIKLVETFAAQAVIAIENVRQFRELQTRLEREAANSSVLQIISQSRSDEKPVFDFILEKAAQLCSAPHAGLHLIDKESGKFVISSIWGEKLQVFEQGYTYEPDSSLAVVRAINRKQSVQIEDAKEEAVYDEGNELRKSLVDNEGIRTFLAVPLLSGDNALGYIALFRKEVQPFTDDEILLVETFAAQAVIAIENVRQFRELQTRLEREAATRKILDAISRSREDEGPVFELLLRSVAELCDLPRITLQIADRDRNELPIVAHWGDSMVHYESGVTKFPLDGTSAPAQAVSENRVVHIPDLAETELYRRGDPVRVASVEKEGIRTYMAVPLQSDGEAIGCLGIIKREVMPFTDDEIMLVESFAAQAVIAIESVRQFREVQSRLERETATKNILEVISQSRDDEQPVFDLIVSRAKQLCGATFAGLVLGSERDALQRVVANDGLTADVMQLWQDGLYTMERDKSQVANAILDKRAINIRDVADSGYYKDGDDRYKTIVANGGIRSTLLVPLVSNGTGIGCLMLARGEVRAFQADEVRLVENFAAQAVIAIENVKQFKALESLNAELGDRVDQQVGEIERMGKLKRFLPAAVADTVVSQGSEKMLSSHRALLGVLFCDIRGFTAFCETAEPEETIEVLQTYHEEMGKLINDHGAGVDHRMGDGIMVLFNDPVPCEDPAGVAVRLAIAMRSRMAEIAKKWKKLGHRLGFGVGVSLGYATVGMVGYEGRSDYTASGTAVNLAARLCDRAEDGEILMSPRAYAAVEDDFAGEPTGEIKLKGIREPVEVYRLLTERSTKA